MKKEYKFTDKTVEEYAKDFINDIYEAGDWEYVIPSDTQMDEILNEFREKVELHHKHRQTSYGCSC